MSDSNVKSGGWIAVNGWAFSTGGWLVAVIGAVMTKSWVVVATCGVMALLSVFVSWACYSKRRQEGDCSDTEVLDALLMDLEGLPCCKLEPGKMSEDWVRMDAVADLVDTATKMREG